MRLAQMRMVQIFIEEIIDLYTAVKEARAADSDEGSTVTRSEVFELTIDFSLRVGKKVEASILGVNQLPQFSSVKWEMIEVVAKNLAKLPDEIEDARDADSPGGRRVTRAEIAEMIGEVVRDSVPDMIAITRR